MCNTLRLHRARLPERVVIGECWARDGLQNETVMVPTDQKVEMIGRLIDAGVPKIEATSFAHPKYLPQFADAEEVLRRIPRRPGVDFRGLCATQKAVERAIRSKDEGYGVQEIALIIAASEAYNQVNVKMTLDENRRLAEELARTARNSGHAVFGWVVTAFGCPLQGDVAPEATAAMAKWWFDIGASYVGFGDTTGSSNPVQVSQLFELLTGGGLDPNRLVAHFHDTRGWGIANCLAALTVGISHFDTSLGGIGGQAKTGAAQVQQGYTGNTTTEDLVGMFEEMGIATGIDLAALLAAGRRAEEVLGRPLRSNLLLAGPVQHQGVAYDRERGVLPARG